MAGMNRFLNRVWRLVMDERTGEMNKILTDEEPTLEVRKLLHTTIKKMTTDIEDGDMKFNTSIAQMMIFVNEMYKQPKISKSVMKDFILLLSPYAPHIAEELWQRLGEKESISYVKWPTYKEELTKADKITVMFSVNGKVRSKAEVDAGTDEKVLEETALGDAMIQKYIAGKQVVKIIVVKNKMVNVVVK
jgi:leucyl-tRNA synthetase